MLGFSMIQVVRKHAHKIDRALRGEVLNLYKPFRWTPCFLHNMAERMIKSTKKLQVIVKFRKGCFEAGCEEINRIFSDKFRCSLKKQFRLVSCCSAEVTPAALEEILESCSHVEKIYLNRKVEAFLNTAVPAANADNIVRNGTRLTGKGVTIAIIDTGLYPHPDFNGRITGFVDFINGRSEPYDDNGHGTHCAGDAAGDGFASGGNYRGPAPEANLIGVKVLNKMGAGSLDTVMEGVHWCIEYNEQNESEKIDIINLSLGSPAQRHEKETDDPMVHIVEEAWKRGIVVCAAAGNSGPEPQTIASPGISKKIITVGALDDKGTVDRADDEAAGFSSRGPTIYGKTKPDILAPGVNIIAARSPGSYIDKSSKGSRVGAEYISLSGTSMATPVCAGIVALMLQHNPQLTPKRIKRRLRKGTVLWNDRDPDIYGAGYINGENSVPN
jgi:serine protease AprX